MSVKIDLDDLQKRVKTLESQVKELMDDHAKAKGPAKKSRHTPNSAQQLREMEQNKRNT